MIALSRKPKAMNGTAAVRPRARSCRALGSVASVSLTALTTSSVLRLRSLYAMSGSESEWPCLRSDRWYQMWNSAAVSLPSPSRSALTKASAALSTSAELEALKLLSSTRIRSSGPPRWRSCSRRAGWARSAVRI
eukprot:scaffold54510_cov35-Tisochrysis_lutea.AAC.1